MPDWRGNNRLDSLRNIVEDGRVSLMFMVPGNSNVVRICRCLRRILQGLSAMANSHALLS